MEHYFKKAAMEHDASVFGFRGIVHTKADGRLRQSGHISYSRVRELMKHKLTSTGYDVLRISMHSSWGTSAVGNGGVPDNHFNVKGDGALSQPKMATSSFDSMCLFCVLWQWSIAFCVFDNKA